MKLSCFFMGHDWTDWSVSSSTITLNRWNECKGSYEYLPGVRYLRTRECERVGCDAEQHTQDQHTVNLGEGL